MMEELMERLLIGIGTLVVIAGFVLLASFVIRLIIEGIADMVEYREDKRREQNERKRFKTY